MTAPDAPATTPPAIEVNALSKRFGAVTAVDDVSFTITEHEAVVLWGANGAGKTTILRCILGVIPFAGSIRVLGHDVRSCGKLARSHLGYVPQEIRLHGEQTVAETASFYARLRGVPLDRATGLLEQWQLRDAMRRPVRGLSGGMKQKLALVIALLADPPVLLLDEPTSNLDVRSQRDFSILLEQLKRAGKTLLCCLHQLGDVWKLADRVIVLERGRCVQAGTPSAVIETLRDRAIVCVTVARERIAEAAGLLEQQGFTVQRNGMQMWVNVPAGRKVEPVRQLIEAGIPLLDLTMDEEPS